MTLDEAIAHPFLDPVRSDKSYKEDGSKIDFEFDKMDLNIDQLR
jgi:hypothetical protein